MCCLCGRRPWCCCINDGDVASTLGDGVTIGVCITYIGIGSTLGIEGAFGVVDYTVVDDGTSTLGSCTEGSGYVGGAVKRCKAYGTSSKALHVVSPATKIGVVNDRGLARSEMVLMAA